MMQEDSIDIDSFVTACERSEKNLIDLEDIRFGEIYLYDKGESYDD